MIIEIYFGRDDIPEAGEIKMFAQYISNLFTFYLPVINTHLKKAVIELIIDCNLTIEDYTFDNKVVTTYNSFHLSEWQAKENKLQVMFNLANQALTRLFERLNISTAILMEVIKKIEGNDFKLNVELCKTPIINKAKDKQAILLAEYKMESVIIVVVFLFSSGDSKHIPLFKTFPNPYIYNQIVKKVKWVNDSEIEIRNNSGEFRICINANGKITTVYAPIGRDVDGIIEEIKFLTKEIYFST